MTQSLTIPQDIREQVLAMADRGDSAQALSEYMASVHLEKILAIRLLAQALHLRLGQAKEMLHTSPAWSFRRAADEQFHSEIIRLAEENRL